jgi:hypothetical protein
MERTEPVTLNPDQFNALYKSLGRYDKKSIAGERFIRQDALEGSSVGDEVTGSEAEWVTHDGYGLEATPVGGLRSVFHPSGGVLEDVPTHKEGVGVINQHRAGEHWSQRNK